MVEAVVLAELRVGARPAPQGQLRIFGLTEGEVGQRLSELPERFGGVRVGFRAHMPEIHVTLRAAPGNEKQLDAAVLFSREQLGDNVFALSEKTLPEVVLESLRRRGETFAAAESCTGGRVGDLLTNVPGASDVFVASMVAYQNEIKERWLGVGEATLRKHGAVSESTVREMAAGVRERTGASWGGAVSGVAGPEGGSVDKPVGTVWLAVSGSVETTRHLSLPFDRERNKLVSAYALLDLVRRTIERLEECA